MTSTMMSSKAIRALMRYHLLKRQARKRVFQNRCFFRQLFKVFKWRRKNRSQLIKEKYNREQEEEEEIDCGYSSSLTDIDIVRRNLWLMIARKEVILAQRRRSYYREQKISRARAMAHRCLAAHLEGTKVKKV